MEVGLARATPNPQQRLVMNKRRTSRNPLWGFQGALPFSVCAALLFAADARAGGTVAECSEAALRAALAGGGLVTFACDGTITLSATITNDSDAVLDGSDHQVVLSGGNAVSVLHVNSGVRLTLVNLTIANGQGVWGGGICNSNGSLTLISVKLRDNMASNVPYVRPGLLAQGGQGGGIYNEGTLNATNCAFSRNAARQRDTSDVIEAFMPPPYISTPALGGAICSSGALNLVDCTFEANGAYAAPGYVVTFNYAPVLVTPGREADGGAISSSGPLVLRNCTFTGNTAQSGGTPPAPSSRTPIPNAGLDGTASYGGAVSAPSVSIYACGFLSNSVWGGDGGDGESASSGGLGGSGNGGAVRASGGYVAYSTFAWNTATGGGGGRGGVGVSYMDGHGTAGGPGGVGGESHGGAVYSAAAGLSVANCTIVGNNTVGGGGGWGGDGAWTAPSGPGGLGGTAYATLFGAADALTNCTLALNVATGGSGGWGSARGTDGNAVGGLVSGATLVNCLLATNPPANCSTWVKDLGHNLSTEGGCFTNLTSLNGVAAKLGALALSGGSTLTLPLLPGSPAIDAGDTASAPAIDQRGFPRPVGASADIGAYEFGSPAYLQARRAGAQIELLAIGVPNQPVSLQASTNLANWSSIATNVFSPGGTWTFRGAADSSQKFFRLYLQ